MYHPTKLVHIVYNKGYKKCNKDNINDSVQDLIDAYLYIMNDAKKYNTILILEDDFIFNKEIKDHTKNIEHFVENNKHFVYRLGCIPFVQIPYNTYTYMGLSCGAHCVLYSKSIRNKILNNKNSINDWDLYINLLSLNCIYYKPLCYQLFNQTENRNNWGNFNTVVYYLSQYILVGIVKLFGIDKTVEPGYSIIYTISKIIPLIIFLLFFKKFQNILPILKNNKRNK